MPQITCTARRIAAHLIFSSLYFQSLRSFPIHPCLLSNLIFCCGQFCIFLVLCSFRMCAVYNTKICLCAICMYSQGAAAAFFGLSPQSYAYGTNLDFCRFLRGHRTQLEHRGTHTSGRTHQPTLHPRTKYQINTIQFIHFSIYPLHRCEAGSESRKHCGSELQERKNSCTTKH
jgi:hypothetical protein